MTTMVYQVLKSFLTDKLKNKDLLKEPLKLTLDSNIQYIINQELSEAIKIFEATGASALLMDVIMEI